MRRLDSLKSLSIYAGEGFEATELPEGLVNLALGGDEEYALPYDLIQAPADGQSTLLSGKLMNYACLHAGGWTFEWLQSDVLKDFGEEGKSRENKLVIFRETDDHSVQRQVFDVDYHSMPDVDTGRKLVTADVDFDGRTDILVCLAHYGTQGKLHYACFLQREDGFVQSESFSYVANPAVDSANQVILSSWRNWAASHGWGVYEYRDGGYVMTRLLTEAPVPDSVGAGEGDEMVWRWTVEELQNGQWATTEVWRSDELARQEIDDHVYNENSTWGIMTERWRTLYNNGLMADFSIYDD